MPSKVSIANGVAPTAERWPFSTLKRGQYFQCDDLTKHTAIRAAATRASKRLNKKFSVSKVKIKQKDGQVLQVIRAYLSK